MIGTTISHYRILSELGRGGMGVVYLAEDTRLARRVALKALPPDFSRDPIRRKRFENEARAAAALNHPGIAAVYQLEEADGELYIIFEYVEGKDLRAALSTRSLNTQQLLLVAVNIAQAMSAAHAQGIVHRDLKPENVLLNVSGEPKILDFGLARMGMEGLQSMEAATASIELTQAGAVVGTVAYMSPEQLECKDIDSRSDVFSFGIMLYEMVSGTHPFSGGSSASTIANIMTQDPKPLSAVDSIHPPELDRIVRKCLRKKREERYQTTQDLAVDLAALAQGMSPLAAAGMPMSSPASTMQRSTDEVMHATAVDNKVTDAYPVPNAGVSKRGLFGWFTAHPQRWWLFHQLYMIFAALPLIIFFQWQIHGWHPEDTFSGNLIFTVIMLFCGMSAILRGYLLILYAFYEHDPDNMHKWMKNLQWMIVFLTTMPLVFIAMQCVSGLKEHSMAASFFLFIGMSGLVLEYLIEPNMNKMAFPKSFEKEGITVFEQPWKKQQTIAGSQMVFTMLLAVPVLAGDINLTNLNLSLTFHDVAIGVMFGLAILGGIISLTVSVLLCVKQPDVVEPHKIVERFLRGFWFIYVVDLLAVSGFIINIWSFKKTAFDIILNSVMTIMIPPCLLALPFYQRKLAREILGPDALVGLVRAAWLDEYRKLACMRLVSLICSLSVAIGVGMMSFQFFNDVILNPARKSTFTDTATWLVYLLLLMLASIASVVHGYHVDVFWKRDRSALHRYVRWFSWFVVFELPTMLAIMVVLLSASFFTPFVKGNILVAMISILIWALLSVSFLMSLRNRSRDLLGPEADISASPLLNDYRKMALSKLVSMICAAFAIFSIQDMLAESLHWRALNHAPSSNSSAVGDNLAIGTLVFLGIGVFLILAFCIHGSLVYAFSRRDMNAIGTFRKWFVLFTVFELPSLGVMVGFMTVPIVLLSPGRNPNLFLMMICMVLGYLGFYVHFKIQRAILKRIMEKQSEITA